MTADLLYPKAPFRAKGIVFPGLLLTTIISCLLLGLTLSSWYSDGFLYKVQNSRRATIQIIVQVLSSVLASLQLFALSTLVKNDTSLSIGRTPMTLDMLKFRNAIRLQSLDLDLRVRHTAFLLILLVAVQFPSALWAGALTPVSTNVEVTRQYQVPQYSHASVSYWDGSCSPGNGNCTSIGNQYPNITDKGTFTYRPWRDLSGVLLNSVASASSRNSSASQHPIPNNSPFTYHGRSYGVASSVGLINSLADSSSLSKNVNISQTNSYQFEENGYLSNVECYYNETSDIEISNLTDNDIYAYIPGDTPNIYWPRGTLSTGPIRGSAVSAFQNNGTVVFVAAVQNSTNYAYGFVNGASYSDFTNIQCTATFAPTVFNVSVDVAHSNITVTPAPGIPAQDIEPTGQIKNNSFGQAQYLSSAVTTIYASFIGQSFLSNVENVQARSNHTSITLSDVQTGVSEALESLIDNALSIYGAAQVVLAADTANATASVQLMAVKLGEPAYVYVSFAINLLVVLIVLVEAIRTRFWVGLPLFNPLDIKSAILAASAGGTALADAAGGRTDGAADRGAGAVRVVVGWRERLATITVGCGEGFERGKGDTRGVYRHVDDGSESEIKDA
ncbi:hypothetical protein IMSHALPRED_004322 [Imshaugia aleurites]|uniref:Uncharacterized protein n=1 Tax=Imshaugia aleurites TaxID=172621 RepID=A0A8H3F5S9_9LECA|nr:hypothetical protein IMSHALPRED_004322 [Imshaugia aleurites]